MNLDIQVERLSKLPIPKQLKKEIFQTSFLDEATKKVTRYVSCLKLFALWELVAYNNQKTVPNFSKLKTLKECEDMAHGFLSWLKAENLSDLNTLRRINLLQELCSSHNRFDREAIRRWKNCVD